MDSLKMVAGWLKDHAFVDMEHALKVLGKSRVERLITEYAIVMQECELIQLMGKVV